MLRQLRVKNYRRFDTFSVTFKTGNILAGPNNCGKSSLIDAIRIVAACFNSTRRQRPTPLQLDDGRIVYGHIVPDHRIGVNLINSIHNYNSDDAEIELTLENEARGVVLLNRVRPTRFYVEHQGRSLNTVSKFGSAFPLKCSIVPTLGALLQDELWVEDETIQKGETTRISSRHLRNVWYRKSDAQFADFARDVSHAWKGVELQKPERNSGDPKYIEMYFSEDRKDREVFWAGFGFQIWLQVLTHLARATTNQSIIIDEPDVYLHPDVQKKLMKILRERYGQFLVATHSVEIINDAEALEIVSIDPDLKNAKRIRGEEEYARLYQYIGSSQNAELARVAKARKVVFVEGKDRRHIAAFARRFDYRHLYSGAVPFVELGGFGGWQKAKHAVWAFKEVLDLDVAAYCLFDKDYRSEDEVALFERRFHEDGIGCSVLRRKEIENYLIEFDALEGAVKKRCGERGVKPISAEEINAIFEEITSEMENKVRAQLSENLQRFLKRERVPVDTRRRKSFDRLFDERWGDLKTRIELVPGKEVLDRFDDSLKERGIGNLTPRMILHEMSPEALDPFFRNVLISLDKFCE